MAYQSKSRSAKVRGMINTGNTCYLNSVIQAIYSFPAFREYVQLVSQQGHKNDLLNALQLTIDKLSDPTELGPFVPPITRDMSVRSHFQPGVQQDAHEFFIFLLDQVSLASGNPLTEQAKSTGLRSIFDIDDDLSQYSSKIIRPKISPSKHFSQSPIASSLPFSINSSPEINNGKADIRSNTHSDIRSNGHPNGSNEAPILSNPSQAFKHPQNMRNNKGNLSSISSKNHGVNSSFAETQRLATQNLQLSLQKEGLLPNSTTKSLPNGNPTNSSATDGHSKLSNGESNHSTPNGPIKPKFTGSNNTLNSFSSPSSLRRTLTASSPHNESITPPKTPPAQSYWRSWISEHKDHASNVTNPFSFKMESSIYCYGCRRTFSSFQYMSLLSAYLPPTGDCGIKECLIGFAKGEIVDFKCASKKCQKAKEHSPIEKRLTIAKEPEILCIHVNRLKYETGPKGRMYLKKLKHHVKFEREINISLLTSQFIPAIGRNFEQHRAWDIVDLFDYTLSPHITPSSSLTPSSRSGGSTPNSGIESIRKSCSDVIEMANRRLDNFLVDDGVGEFDYVLYSIIVHLGNQSGGHYVCYRALNTETDNISDDWLYISDSEVRPVSFELVKKQEAYMLFYKKKSKPVENSTLSLSSPLISMPTSETTSPIDSPRSLSPNPLTETANQSEPTQTAAETANNSEPKQTAVESSNNRQTVAEANHSEATVAEPNHSNHLLEPEPALPDPSDWRKGATVLPSSEESTDPISELAERPMEASDPSNHFEAFDSIVNGK